MKISGKTKNYCLQPSSKNSEKYQELIVRLLQGCKTIGMCQIESRIPKRKAVSDAHSTAVCLENISMEKDRSQPNPFVVDMFIHLPTGALSKRQNGNPSKTFRRVLLDTGADFNLISHRAYAELNLATQPYQGRVHSIGGYSELSSVARIQWHFRSGKLGRTSTLHCAKFYVLSQEASPHFDCILGRQWIFENWGEFVDLVDINPQNRVPCAAVSPAE